MGRHIKENKPVLIHCNAGRGRTRVLVIGYLMKEQKIPMEVALKRIKQIRKKIPHRDIQQEVLKKYELYLKDHQ